MICLTATG